MEPGLQHTAAAIDAGPATAAGGGEHRRDPAHDLDDRQSPGHNSVVIGALDAAEADPQHPATAANRAALHGAAPRRLPEARMLLAGLADSGSILTPKGLPTAAIGATDPTSRSGAHPGLPVAKITTPERADVATAKTAASDPAGDVPDDGAAPGDPVGLAEPATAAHAVGTRPVDFPVPDGSPVNTGHPGPDSPLVPGGPLEPGRRPDPESRPGSDMRPDPDGQSGPHGQAGPDSRPGSENWPDPEGQSDPDGRSGLHGRPGPDSQLRPDSRQVADVPQALTGPTRTAPPGPHLRPSTVAPPGQPAPGPPGQGKAPTADTSPTRATGTSQDRPSISAESHTPAGRPESTDNRPAGHADDTSEGWTRGTERQHPTNDHRAQPQSAGQSQAERESADDDPAQPARATGSRPGRTRAESRTGVEPDAVGRTDPGDELPADRPRDASASPSGGGRPEHTQQASAADDVAPPGRTKPTNRGPVRGAERPPPSDKPDDRYAAPRDLFTAPAPPDSPAAPPPPSYSALVGGAVPGDPTSTYSAIISQRLRAFLPWPTTEDPLALIIRVHKQIHAHADVSLLRRAYGMAEQMHRGQMRKSGEPFITHPLAVTEILADLGMDTTTLVAALLHDTVEDTSYTLGALERDFGAEVALLVDGVTKFDKVFYGADAEAETIRKMIVSAGRDVRVLVIKLADRLHNMRTLDARSRSSQVRIATATREVLIPLCERLGIQALKRELEDWVLRAVSPSGYALIANHVQHRSGWDGYLDRVTSAVSTELSRFRIDATVTPRPRHLYSIWKDTVDGNYAEPHDLPRVVIIVGGPETDCYAALGAVHGKWRPVPGRFKDFIATPKNNLYRSLHTTVLGPEGHSLEVLIRTESMHRAAEYGIIANFRYPQNAAKFGPATKAEQLDWLRRLLDWEAAASDPAQFIASLRCDLAETQILVFTSTGRPVLLPAEATPVDLAYILGADIGNRCIGARLNGRLISLSSPLADGDTVEIITRAGQRDEFDFDEDAPARGPSPEWLEFVKTPHARLHISRWFEDHDAPAITVGNKVRLGRLAIGLALRQRGRGLASDLPLVRLAPRLGFPDLETLLVAVADHSRTADEVVNELIALVDHSPR